jgi:hypothetical protein
MKKILTGCFIFIFASIQSATAAVRLVIISRSGSSSVIIRWNMTDYPGYTTYALFESDDGYNWRIAAANPTQRRYTETTILEYHENFVDQQKLYFRVKVYDPGQNIIAVSNTALVVNPRYSATTKTSTYDQTSGSLSKTDYGSSSWQMSDESASDQIYLNYVGHNPLRGVINVNIFDNAGKDLIKFRASSKSRQLSIPINQLLDGYYILRISVNDEIQFNKRFKKI